MLGSVQYDDGAGIARMGGLMAARLSLERPNERRLRPPLFLTPLSAAPRRRPGSRGKPPPAAIQMRPILATCQPSGTPFPRWPWVGYPYGQRRTSSVPGVRAGASRWTKTRLDW